LSRNQTLNVFLSKEGIQTLAAAEAAGTKWEPFAWYFLIWPSEEEPPSGLFQVGTFTPTYPPAGELVAKAVGILDAKIQQVYADAEGQARAYREQKESLLAITNEVKS
jgi:hypothetical protein